MVRRRSTPPARRGPSLIGTAARTAVISGTATATSRAVDNSINERARQSQQQAEQIKVQQLASMPIQPIAPAAQPDLLAQLTQLAQLKDAGALSEEEFQLAKAKLLN